MKPEIFKAIDGNKSRDLLRFLLTFASLIVIVIGMKSIASQLIAPILLSVFLALLLYPLFKRFKKEGRAGWITLLFTIGSILAVLTGLVLLVSVSFSQFSENLDVYIADITQQLSELLERLGIENTLTDLLTSTLTEENVTAFIKNIAGNISSLLSMLFFVPLVSILLLLQIDSFMKSPLSKAQFETDKMDKFSNFSKSITIYVIGRTKVNLFTGTMFFVVLFIMDIDFALMWGLLMAFLSYIPYIGAALASIPAILLAFASYGGIGAGIVILAITIINMIAENALDPYVQSKGNKLSALVVVISLFFWVWLFGPIGAILSIPMTVMMKIVLGEFDETRWIATLMEGNFNKTSVELKKSDTINKMKKKVLGKK